MGLRSMRPLCVCVCVMHIRFIAEIKNSREVKGVNGTTETEFEIKYTTPVIRLDFAVSLL